MTALRQLAMDWKQRSLDLLEQSNKSIVPRQGELLSVRAMVYAECYMDILEAIVEQSKCNPMESTLGIVHPDITLPAST